MEKELIDIVLQKSFIELSMEDRVALSEWCTSEEEYDQMKNVFLEVERMKLNQTTTVRPETKKSLDALFMEKHQKAPIFWNNSVMTLIYPVDKPMRKRPLIQVAAAALLFLLSYPLIDADQLNEPTIQTAKHESSKTGRTKVKNAITDPVKLPLSNNVSTSKKEIQSQEPILVASNEVFAPEMTISSTMAESSLSFNSSLSTSPSWTGATTFAFTVDTPAAVAIDDVFGDHPDGVFDGETISAFSEPVSEDPGILDLLTVAF